MRFLLLIFIFYSFIAYAEDIVGKVFLDKNSNGIYDFADKCLRNIAVSNGDTIVFTDAKGQYNISLSEGESLFPILPDGYDMRNAPHSNASFFYLDKVENIPLYVDFALEKRDAEDKFNVAVIGDIQTDGVAEENYTGATLMTDLLSRNDIDFGIALGDIVNNNYRDYPDLLSMLSQLSWPVWTLAGNHDRDTSGDVRQNSRFNAVFGSSDYAFNYGDIHFIVLNDVLPNGKHGYDGGYSDSRLRFIERDLSYVPRAKRVVICQHIPLLHCKGKERLLQLLAGRGEVLVLSGHTHTVGRNFTDGDGVIVHELVAGAACGSWWQGERAWDAIPSGLMNCGTPRGYFVLSFDGIDYNIKYKGINMDPSLQMGIWVNGIDTLDSRVRELAELPTNFIAANIYGGSDSTFVELSIDGGEWRQMKKTDMVDVNVLRLISMGADGVYPSLHSDKYALRRYKSPHIWNYTPESPLSDGVHRISVRGRDKYGFSAEGERVVVVAGN